MGPLIPLFWTSGDICPGFQSQGEPLALCAPSPVHNGFLRFTSGATPADLLRASIAAGHVSYMHVAEVGCGDGLGDLPQCKQTRYPLGHRSG